MAQITSVKYPKYANAEGTMIDCIITTDHYPYDLPFTASSNDPESHGMELYNKIVSGLYGPIAEYIEPEITIAE